MKYGRQIPPKLAQRILLRFLRDDLAEEVLGDLDEKFYSLVKNKSLFRARMNYWFQVLNYLRPFALKKSKTAYSNHYGMFQSYFKVGFRNLLKQWLYSVINVAGLALGLTCFILISLYVQHEFSYDRFFENSDRIFRIYQRSIGNDALGTDYSANTPVKLASVIMHEFPEVAHATAIQDHTALLSYGEDHFFESGLWADEHFFQVFPYPIKLGNPNKLLPDSRSIVLSESLAFKIFGENDPVGETLIYQNGGPFVVTGVMLDPPPTASIRFSFVVHLLSNQSYADELQRSTWTGNVLHTFVTLRKDSDPEALEEKFAGLLTKYRDPVAYADYPFQDQYIVQPLPDIHLQSNVNGDIGLKGNSRYLYFFSITAIIVLILACVNYMNLAIARSIKRAREVSLRKVVGAVRSQIIGQFLGESMLISFLALLLAAGLAYLLLPVFSELVERPLVLDLVENKLLIPGLVLLVILVGLLSGSYPAFVISSLRPNHILKAQVDSRISGSRVQRWLIIGQYAVAIIMITSSVVIYRQLDFMQEKELGYDKEHVVAINSWNLMKHYDAIRNEWLQHPGIKSVTASSDLPTNITSSSLIDFEKGGKAYKDLAIYRLRVDYDFLNVFGIALISGRNFSRDIASDLEESYLINETAAKALGWTAAEAPGKQLNHLGAKTIIGVVKDFHMHSMHLPVMPLMIRLEPDRGRFISVKVKPDGLAETISLLERTSKKYTPYPFEYQFLDEHFDRLYKAETKLKEMFAFFTVVSILIASLGLFGLAAFMSGQRTKEIGIRKVLGASVSNILTLLSKDFIVMIAIAFCVSMPIAWYVMYVWLQNFAYRIDLEWWMFALAGFLTFFVATITISYQSLKASCMDPVESLRTE